MRSKATSETMLASGSFKASTILITIACYFSSTSCIDSKSTQTLERITGYSVIPLLLQHIPISLKLLISGERFSHQQTLQCVSHDLNFFGSCLAKV